MCARTVYVHQLQETHVQHTKLPLMCCTDWHKLPICSVGRDESVQYMINFKEPNISSDEKPPSAYLCNINMIFLPSMSWLWLNFSLF